MFNLPGESSQDHLDGARYYRELRYLNRIKVHFLVYLPTADIVDHGLAADALPADARERLAEGWESDFYDQHEGRTDEVAEVAGFAALYKLLPALPERLVKWLLGRPSPLQGGTTGGSRSSHDRTLPPPPPLKGGGSPRTARIRRLGRIPAPLMAVLQGLMATRSGDLRFLAYLSLYPGKVVQAIAARLQRLPTTNHRRFRGGMEWGADSTTVLNPAPPPERSQSGKKPEVEARTPA
jgi:hypothetical protein